MNGTTQGPPGRSTDLESVARDYFAALEARDHAKCMDFYAEDASIKFQSGIYNGRNEIEGWHKDRFGVNLRVLELESIEVYGGVVVIDVVIASDRLAAWKISRLPARITFDFENGLIKHGDFAPRMINPVNMIRSS